MQNSFKILLFFIGGILIGTLHISPPFLASKEINVYLLYLLLFLIGVNVGGNEKLGEMIRKIHIKIVFVPISVIIGTFLGVTLFSFLTPNLRFIEALAISFGFGYYSLSSVLIAKISGETLGVIALLSNIFREIITLLFTPSITKHFGKLAPIASGGATSMDTTLPIITKSVGKEYVIVSVFSGFVLTILVPFIVPLILKI